ncbi:MAG: molybdopterin-dependent oxidoreductase [Devosia sp.]
MSTTLRAMALGLVLFLAPGLAQAQSEPVILTIDGAISGGVPVDMTRTQLEALGSASVATSTPWHEGAPQFEGVPMSALLEHVGATGEVAEVLALNDYRTTIPVSDFMDYPVILALKQDGEYMSVRNKGPLFIIYPFDDFDELQADIYYSRSAWQVRRITIK